MKILQINTVCGFGSTGRIATELYKVLEKQGHECNIAYGRREAPEGIDSIKIGSKLDSYIHILKTRVFDKHGFGSVNATKKFIEEVKEYNPDIIHLHNIHGDYINIEILFNYIKEANKPVVWTLHDCWAFTGHCAYFDYVGCDKWKGGCNNCPQKNSYPSSKLIDNSKFNYKKKKELFTSVKNMTIVTPSKWLANLVKESFLGKYHVEVINNGIDLEVFKPTESNFREKYNIEDKFIILGVASGWEERKGLNYFVELSKMLSKEYQIVIVGLNEKQKKELPQEIIAITRTNNVRELAEIYSSADIFVNPTLEENFPTTNLEALACGTPIITFDTGGSPECIDEYTGIVMNNRDISELMDIIINININFSFDGEHCINRVHKNYDKDFKFNEYILLYENVFKTVM